MQACLLGCCPESYVIDNDMLGAINRTVRGIEVNEDTMAFETMQQVCTEGPGHYLGHEQTLSRMQSDYLYPELGDRENINNWIDQGSSNIEERASERVIVLWLRSCLLAAEAATAVEAAAQPVWFKEWIEY